MNSDFINEDHKFKVREKEKNHLGGNRYYGNPESISEPVLAYLIRRFSVLAATLANGKIIAMTHGTPGQAGHHHVDNQDEVYWITVMKTMDYTLLYNHSMKIRQIGQDSYFARSGLVFGKNMPDS